MTFVDGRGIRFDNADEVKEEGSLTLSYMRVGVVGTEPRMALGAVVGHLLAAAEPNGAGNEADDEIRATGRFAPATVTFAHGADAHHESQASVANARLVRVSHHARVAQGGALHGVLAGEGGA